MNTHFYQSVYEMMSDGVYVFDERGKIIHINQKGAELLGYRVDEVLYQEGHDLFHRHINKEKIPLQECSLHIALCEKKQYRGFEYYETKCGDIIEVEVIASPTFEDDKFIGYVVIFKDISHSKKTQNLYNAIFQAASLGICLTDAKGYFVSVNPEYCNIYGYTESELIGEHFTIIVPDGYKEALSKLHDDFIHTDMIELSKEWQVQRKDKQIIHIIATAAKLQNVPGGPYKITTVHDVTDLHISREKEKIQELMLTQQSKMAAIGEMLGAIAHQWKQPLNSINLALMNMQLKREAQKLDDETFENAVETIESMIAQMNSTMNDFMDFFKPNKTISQVNIKMCIQKALKIMEAQFKNRSIIVNFDVDESLSTKGVMGELEQVFLNLLSNVKDAYASGEFEEKQLYIYSKKLDQKSFEVCFEDRAGGIDEEFIASIFDPFVTSKEAQGGTGIGLHMSSTIIKKTFDGKMLARNVYQNGTKVGVKMSVVLPHE